VKIHHDIPPNASLDNTVITIGTFDGIHGGHRKIFDRLKAAASVLNADSVVITFEPHPRSIIYPRDESLRILTTIEEKIHLLEGIGIDHLVIIPFSVEFSQLHPQEYIENFLVNKFHPRAIVVGFDHQFGLNRGGDYALLQQNASKFNYQLIKIEKQALDDIKISSTNIRKAISDGRLGEAAKLLKYNYYLTGEVIKGRNVGQQLGYPTANIKLSSPYKLLPKPGIYAAFAYLDNQRFDGLLYIGAKPTLENGKGMFIEIHLKGFEGYLYGEQLRIEIIRFVRNDAKFSNMENLRQEIKKDDRRINQILSAYKKEHTV
jgi:riboflavin kinase/FMN adenylyltransferase